LGALAAEGRHEIVLPPFKVFPYAQFGFIPDHKAFLYYRVYKNYKR